MKPQTIDVNNGWYEYITGMIVCGECLAEAMGLTNNGTFKGDEAVTWATVESKAETPAQCDNCLKQSDDYDEVLDEE